MLLCSPSNSESAGVGRLWRFGISHVLSGDAEPASLWTTLEGMGGRHFLSCGSTVLEEFLLIVGRQTVLWATYPEDTPGPVHGLCTPPACLCKRGETIDRNVAKTWCVSSVETPFD